MAPRKSFKLLAVGNSFSDNALNYIYPILDSFGVEEIVLGNLYIGGCSVETHLTNAASDANAYDYRKNTDGLFDTTADVKMSTALKDEEWQYITLQQASGDSGIESTYNEMIDALNDYVRENVINPNMLQVGWHMTWAYQKNSTHAEFPKYDSDQIVMYNSIVNCVQSQILGNDKFDFVIPAGTAIQNARTSYIGDTLTVDGYHLDELGQFIAGMTWVLLITGWNVADIITAKLPQQFLPYYDVVIEAVTNALKNPFEVTPSQITTAPDTFITHGNDEKRNI